MKPCSCHAGVTLASLLTCATLASAQTDNDSNAVTQEKECLSSLWETASPAQGTSCLKNLIDESTKASGDSSELKLTPSYSLGVKFQREVAKKFPQLSYLQFLKGLLDEASSNTRFSDEELTKSLKMVLLSARERSEKRVREFSLKSGVTDWQGIYYIDHTAASNGELGEHCQSATSSRTYVLDYTRLRNEDKKNEDKKNKDKKNEDKPIDVNTLSYECLRVDSDEIIRGLRTALRKMKKNDVWEVLIPPALAYGEDGMKSDNADENVEPGEALHFVIRLYSKT